MIREKCKHCGREIMSWSWNGAYWNAICPCPILEEIENEAKKFSSKKAETTDDSKGHECKCTGKCSRTKEGTCCKDKKVQGKGLGTKTLRKSELKCLDCGLSYIETLQHTPSLMWHVIPVTEAKRKALGNPYIVLKCEYCYGKN